LKTKTVIQALTTMQVYIVVLAKTIIAIEKKILYNADYSKAGKQSCK